MGHYKDVKDKPDNGKEKAYHEGSNDERKEFIAKVRRMREKMQEGESDILDELEKWLLSRDERYRRRP